MWEITALLHHHMYILITQEKTAITIFVGLVDWCSEQRPFEKTQYISEPSSWREKNEDSDWKRTTNNHPLVYYSPRGEIPQLYWPHWPRKLCPSPYMQVLYFSTKNTERKTSHHPTWKEMWIARSKTRTWNVQKDEETHISRNPSHLCRRRYSGQPTIYNWEWWQILELCTRPSCLRPG